MTSGKLSAYRRASQYFEKIKKKKKKKINYYNNNNKINNDVREALGISPGVPVFDMDARNKASCRDALLVLLELLVTRLSSKVPS